MIMITMNHISIPLSYHYYFGDQPCFFLGMVSSSTMRQSTTSTRLF